MAEIVVDRVRKRVAEVMALPVDEVQATSRLLEDLGAESLDLVELMYLLEQEFGVVLSRDDVSLSAQLGMSEDEAFHGEVLTDKALELLRQRFPQAHDVLREGCTRRQLAGLLTVEEVARSIEKKLSPA